MMLGAAFVASVLVVGALAIPQGEVVTLHTRDAAGSDHETHLWIVDIEDHAYLRAGTAEAGWLLRARKNPGVELSRGDASNPYTAVPVDDAALRAALNDAMDAKYGVANGLFHWMVDTNAVVAVRLDPRAASAAPSPAH